MVQLLEWPTVGSQGALSDFEPLRLVNALVGGVLGVTSSALVARIAISHERLRGGQCALAFGELMVSGVLQ